MNIFRSSSLIFLHIFIFHNLLKLPHKIALDNSIHIILTKSGNEADPIKW